MRLLVCLSVCLSVCLVRKKLGANNIGCLYTPVEVNGQMMAWICTNIGCTELFRTGPNMLMHQQLDCMMRRVQCAHGCRVSMPYINLAAHDRVYVKTTTTTMGDAERSLLLICDCLT